MKGYMISNGAVVMSENNGNVIGYMVLANGKRAKINIPTKYANVIRLANVSHLIGAFNYATNHNCPVHIGKFAIWMDTKGWHFTSWDKMDVLSKMFSILYKA